MEPLSTLSIQTSAITKISFHKFLPQEWTTLLVFTSFQDQLVIQGTLEYSMEFSRTSFCWWPCFFISSTYVKSVHGIMLKRKAIFIRILALISKARILRQMMVTLEIQIKEWIFSHSSIMMYSFTSSQLGMRKLGTMSKNLRIKYQISTGKFFLSTCIVSKRT